MWFNYNWWINEKRGYEMPNNEMSKKCQIKSHLVFKLFDFKSNFGRIVEMEEIV